MGDVLGGVLRDVLGGVLGYVLGYVLGDVIIQINNNNVYLYIAETRVIPF